MAQLRVEAGNKRREISLPAGEEMVFLTTSEPRGLHAATEKPDQYLAALIHTGGHWMVFAPRGANDVAIDGLQVPSLKVLDDQSVLTVGEYVLRLAERVEEVLKADAPVILQGKLCPYCQARFVGEQRVIYCPICGLAYHAPCLLDGKKCGSYPYCGYEIPDDEVIEKESTRR